MKNAMEFTAKQLAQILKGTVEGNEDATATRFSKIEHGKPGSLCFFANPKYEQYVYSSKATIILVKIAESCVKRKLKGDFHAPDYIETGHRIALDNLILLSEQVVQVQA